MKLKIVELDGKTFAEVKDGMPVYLNDDGSETGYDVPGMAQSIKRANGEAKAHREAKEAAEKALKGFEGLDPAAARKAVETVSAIDGKKLIDAGEKDAAIKAALEPYMRQLEALTKERDELSNSKSELVIGGAFASSKFVSERLAIPADMTRAFFGRHFKVEGNQAVAYDSDGNKLFSSSNPGKAADFDEAISLLVDRYPNKDHILKGTGSSGSGASQSAASMGQKTMSKLQFDSMDHIERSAKLKEGYRISD